MIDYSEFFNEKALVALFSTNDRNYKSDTNKKNFIEDINLKYENFRFPSQTHSQMFNLPKSHSNIMILMD